MKELLTTIFIWGFAAFTLFLLVWGSFGISSIMTMYILCESCKKETYTIDAVVYKGKQLCKNCRNRIEEELEK